ncbi:MAG: hypothetical protein JWQ24_4917 [Tardiphaga sp.]|nr:hypothetical protein [Tardiphaga sp.]
MKSLSASPNHGKTSFFQSLARLRLAVRNQLFAAAFPLDAEGFVDSSSIFLQHRAKHLLDPDIGRNPDESGNEHPVAIGFGKTNAQVNAINAEVRTRLKASKLIRGPELAVSAVSRSGNAQTLHFAMGDRVRFSLRHDELGVINGTMATVTHIDRTDTVDPTMHVVIGARLAHFKLSEIADELGRARLGHAYATTIYGCQGATTEHAFVLLSPSMNRSDIVVASSRARQQTKLFLDTKACDAQLRLDLSLSERRGALVEPERRLEWLAGRLSRLHVKTCTLDLTVAVPTSRDPGSSR